MIISHLNKKRKYDLEEGEYEELFDVEFNNQGNLNIHLDSEDHIKSPSDDNNFFTSEILQSETYSEENPIVANKVNHVVPSITNLSDSSSHQLFCVKSDELASNNSLNLQQRVDKDSCVPETTAVVNKINKFPKSHLQLLLHQYDSKAADKLSLNAQNNENELICVKALKTGCMQPIAVIIKETRRMKTNFAGHTNIYNFNGWTDLEPLRNTSVTITNSDVDFLNGVYQFAGFINHAASYVGGRNNKYGIYRGKLNDRYNVFAWFIVTIANGKTLGSIHEPLHYFSADTVGDDSLSAFDHTTTPLNSFFRMSATDKEQLYSTAIKLTVCIDTCVPPPQQQSSLLSALQQYDDSKTYKQAQVSYQESQFIKALQSISDDCNNALIKQILPGLVKHIRLLKADRNSYTNICYHDGWTDLEPLRNTSVTVTNSVLEMSDGVYRFAGFINHAASYVGGRDGKFSIYRCKLRDKDNIYVWFLANNCVGDKGSLALSLDHQEQLHYFSSSVGATSFDHVTTPVNKFFCMTAKNLSKPCNITVTVNHLSGSAGATYTDNNINNSNASFAVNASNMQSLAHHSQAVISSTPKKVPQVKCTTLQSFIAANTSIVNLLQQPESSAEKHQTILNCQDEIVRYLKTLRSVPTSQLIVRDDTYLQRNSLIGNSKLLVSNADTKLSKINGLYNFVGLLNGSGHYVKKFNSGNKCEIFKCKIPTYVTNIGTAGSEAAPLYIWLLVDRTKDQANVTDGLLMYFSLCDSNSTGHSYPDSNANWYGAYNTTGGGERSNQLSVFVSTTPGNYLPSPVTYAAFAAAGAQALSAAKASQQAIAARLPSSVLSHSLVNCSVPVSRLPDTATAATVSSNNNGDCNNSNSINNNNISGTHSIYSLPNITVASATEVDLSAETAYSSNESRKCGNNSSIISSGSGDTDDQMHLPAEVNDNVVSLDGPEESAYSPAYSPAPENESNSPSSSPAVEITTITQEQECLVCSVATTVAAIDTKEVDPALDNSNAFGISLAVAAPQDDQSNSSFNRQLITLLVDKFPTLTRSTAKRAMLHENARIAVELNLSEQTVAVITVLFSQFMLGLQEQLLHCQSTVTTSAVSSSTLSGDYDVICVSILTVLFHPLPADAIESSLVDLMIEIEAVSDSLADGVAIVPIYCYCMMLKQYL